MYTTIQKRPCYLWFAIAVDTHTASFMLLIDSAESRLVRSDFGSESTTGHCCLSVLQMISAGSEGSSAINLSELIIHAPPPVASEVHTSLGNHEMGSKYGMPAYFCQYTGKLYISRLARSWYGTGTSPFIKLQIQAGMTILGLIGLVAGCFEDLAERWQSTTWWVARYSSHTIFCLSWEKITGTSACGLKESLRYSVAKEAFSLSLHSPKMSIGIL